MKVVLTTLNAKYIHKNLALRWLYVSRIPEAEVELMEFVIKDDLERISDQIAQRQPEVIGISVYIWNADLTRKWIAILKRKLPHVRILIGGPEVSINANWLDTGIGGAGAKAKTFWQAVRRSGYRRVSQPRLRQSGRLRAGGPQTAKRKVLAAGDRRGSDGASLPLS
ncbi:MAG: cobalamin-dependent protein [Holdemania filiformis]